MTSNDLKIPRLTSSEPTNEIVLNFTNKTVKNKNKKFVKGADSHAENIGN